MSGFHDFVVELFAGLDRDLGPVRIKRMFGGAGIYAGDVMFGLIDDDAIFLKTDEKLRAEMAAEGATHWVYRRKDGTVEVSSYWRLPDAALDDPEEAVRWGKRALEAARAGKKPKAKKKKT